MTRLEVECLKGRDIPDVADPFTIQGRPYINEQGDFAIVHYGGIDIDSPGVSAKERLDSVVKKIQSDSKVSLRTLSKLTGWNTETVKTRAASVGWTWTPVGWKQGATAVEAILSNLTETSE